MRRSFPIWIAAAGILVAGCHTDMWVQPRSGPLEENNFYGDRRASRAPVEGTIARSGLRLDEARYRGFSDGKLVRDLPPTLNIDGKEVDTRADLKAVLKRGKDRFMVFCTHCHGAVGDGNGMITQRGLALRRKPASYHDDRLRNMPIGHFFDVMTNGYGTMFSYASRLEPDDRWAVAAYIRALQLSQNAAVSEVGPPQAETEEPKQEAAH
ncbi:MAG: hypothetical protein HONBIEJF_01270 [Fimbriimonadaceae bacterium]|nr:hypothetical protein [Fimbriimonadaceae bacterium]